MSDPITQSTPDTKTATDGAASAASPGRRSFLRNTSFGLISASVAGLVSACDTQGGTSRAAGDGAAPGTALSSPPTALPTCPAGSSCGRSALSATG